MGKHTTQYIRVFDYMIKDLGLSGNSLITYALIHGFTGNGQECFMTQSSIGRLLRINRTTVHRIVNKLCKRNLISVDKQEDRAIYKAVNVRTDGKYFDIFKDTLEKMKGNSAVIFSYLRANMKDNLSKIAENLNLSLNTVSAIVSELNGKKFLMKEYLRNGFGQIKGIVCRFGDYKKCNTVTKNATTETKKCHTYTKNDTTKKYINTKNSKSANKFNEFEQNIYDFNALEAALLAL